jgi:hypothetical protein
MAPKKKAGSKKAAKRPAAKPSGTKRPVARKSAARKSTRKQGTRKSTARPSTAKPRRARRVRAVVKEKARQGIEVAREGLERIKQSTFTLVEEVKERIAGGADRSTPDSSQGNGDLR